MQSLFKTGRGQVSVHLNIQVAKKPLLSKKETKETDIQQDVKRLDCSNKIIFSDEAPIRLFGASGNPKKRGAMSHVSCQQ